MIGVIIFFFQTFLFGFSSQNTLPAMQVQNNHCDRDCTKKPHDNMNCPFQLTLSKLFTDSLERKADGHQRSVLVYNGQLPGPTFTVCEGDNVTVTLINRLTENTTLHFHGIHEKQESPSHGDSSKGGPWSDGVPLVTQCPIPSLGSFTYTFLGNSASYNNAPAGTYWYHSHTGRQRLDGAAGKLIIMPRQKRSDIRIDVDDPDNSLFLQEWYPNLKNEIPTSLLVNGKGKQSEKIYKCTYPTPEEKCIDKYKEGVSVTFTKETNTNYPPGTPTPTSQPNYEVFHVEPHTSYRFRIIGGIGDNVPIRIDIEGHKFTAIATDSSDIVPEPNFNALWIAGGERYDIVIKTKRTPKPDTPYKINIFSSIQGLTLCSLAWLKYPNQIVDHIKEADCTTMENVDFSKVLNPVPNHFPDWNKPNYFYPHRLKAKVQARDITNNLNTQYISMKGINFNGFSMSYPIIPFLFQSSGSGNGKRCGVACTKRHEHGTITTVCDPTPKMPSDGHCGTVFPPPTTTSPECKCQHVIEQPSSTGNYWFEIILINGDTTAHPIHHHGGWFNIVGMGQYDHQKSRAWIKEQYIAGLLPTNLNLPIFKDTVQVPTNGYAIYRFPINNRGVWLVHCHINAHFEDGMAMVIQIGSPLFSMGHDDPTAKYNLNFPCP